MKTKIFAAVIGLQVAWILATSLIHETRLEIGTLIRLEYGLERYYVPEGTGNPSGKLTVDVALTKNGKGTIKEVYVDGQPYAQAMAAKVRR